MKAKLTLTITLEGEDAIALQRCQAECERFGIGPARIAKVLLARAAESYASSDDVRGNFWCFDLRRRTREEDAAWRLLNASHRTLTSG